MSHNLEIISGRASMAYQGELPWHGLGEKMPEEATVEEFFLSSKLNYSVQLSPIFAQIHPEFPAIPGGSYRAMVRPDTQAMLGVVTEKYRPIQNSELAALAGIFQKDGRVSVESAGVLGIGERVWMALRWKEPIAITPSDTIRPFLVLTNGHDGRHAQESLATSVRVVCQNTLNIAENAKAKIRVLHTGDTEAKMKMVAATLGATEAAISEFRDEAVYLSSKTVLDSEAQKFWDELLPNSIPGTPDTSTKAINQRKALAVAYDSAPGATPGTAYGLLNAVTYWADHDRSVRGGDKNLLNSMWFGSSAALKGRARSLAAAL